MAPNVDISQVKSAYILMASNLRQSGIALQDPKPTCRTCSGRGYSGWNQTSKSVDVCNCIFKDKDDYGKIQTHTVNRAMKRRYMMIRGQKGHGTPSKYADKIVKQRRESKQRRMYV